MLHQIGSGVLGPVFRTYDPQRDRLVAVKAFKLDIVPEDVARLADALRRLAANAATHPGIVRVVDAGLEGTSPFVAMEYASGESLDVALRELAPAPLSRALPLLIDVGRAIDAAWADGRGHGALHPRDVIVSPGSGDTRVTGFGIVPALESIGVRPPVRRPYTAPERAAGGPWDVRADVYSLGAIAHELLTGRRPLGSGEQDGTLAQDLTPEQRVSVRRVLAAAMAERPDDRYETAGAFVAALEAVARGEPAVVPPTADTVQVTSRKLQVSADKPAALSLSPSAPEAPPGTPEPRSLGTPEPGTSARGPRGAFSPSVGGGAPTPMSEDSESASAGARASESPQPIALGVGPQRPERSGAPRALREEPRNLGTPPRGAPRMWQPVDPDAPGRMPDSFRTEQTAPSSRPPAIFAALSLPPVTSDRPYPWSALAAVAAAGLILGGVVGYQFGLRRVESVVSQVTSGTPPGRATTDVPVTPEPLPPQKSAAAPATERGSQPSGEAITAVTKPGDDAGGSRARSAARVADVRGRIVVRSAPSGALVTLDGRLQGETPLTLRDLGLGAHTLQIARPGYVPRTDRITLTSASPAQTVNVALEPGLDTRKAAAAEIGSIYVDSIPRGARVLVDGRAVGATPVQLPELPTGRHTVRIDLAGHKSLTTEVVVKPGVPAKVAVRLEPIR